jgi:hypothetical protein
MIALPMILIIVMWCPNTNISAQKPNTIEQSSIRVLTIALSYFIARGKKPDLNYVSI